jgi:hypothetical protein
MREIDLKTNLNVILYNFVDHLSKWDYFIASHILEHYKNNYKLSSVEEKYLEKYRVQRKEFNWEAEAELLKWAFDGFDKESRYSPLLPTINHFKENNELMNELKNGLLDIENVKDEIEVEFKNRKVEELIEVFSVFETNPHEGVLPAYLVYSPWEGKTQGGANGDGIYTQVPRTGNRELQVIRSASTVFHEYLHKELNPGRFFRENKNQDGFYSSKHKEIYPDAIEFFVEEVIVHCLSNVMTFDESPDFQIQNYSRKEEVGDQHFVFLWKTIKEVWPVLKEFREGEILKSELILKLDEYFRSLV